MAVVVYVDGDGLLKLIFDLLDSYLVEFLNTVCLRLAGRRTGILLIALSKFEDALFSTSHRKLGGDDLVKA